METPEAWDPGELPGKLSIGDSLEGGPLAWAWKLHASSPTPHSASLLSGVHRYPSLYPLLKNHINSWVCWHIPVILALGRLKQEYHQEVEASLGNIVGFCLKKITPPKKRKNGK